MKKIVSLILVAATIIGIVGFSTVSSCFAASEENIGDSHALAIEANAHEISKEIFAATGDIDDSEEFDVPEYIDESVAQDVPEYVDESDDLEVPEYVDESECPDVPEYVDETEGLDVCEYDEVQKSAEAVVLEYEFDESINYVDGRSLFYTPDQMRFVVLNHDADAKCALVQKGEEYFFIVEWAMTETTGFVQLTKEVFEGEEFFICGGDELLIMIVRSFEAAENMEFNV